VAANLKNQKLLMTRIIVSRKFKHNYSKYHYENASSIVNIISSEFNHQY